MKTKKPFLLVLAPLFALASLTGCSASDLPLPSGDGSDPSTSIATSETDTSGEGTSIDTSGEGTSIDTSVEVGDDWTAEEKAMMQRCLHGVILPFPGIAANVTTRTNSQGGIELRVNGIGNMEAGFLASYAELFTEDDGWMGGDVSAEIDFVNGCAYGFIKKVMGADGTPARYVSVFFTGMGNGTYDPTGVFYMEAFDPYVYEFPTQFIAAWLQEVYGSSIAIPEISAEYYNLDSEGVLVCGIDNPQAEALFTRILVATNNFTVDEERDSEGYLRAHPKDGRYLIRFKYDADRKELIITAGPVVGWNAAIIADFYTKYGVEPLAVPPVDGEDYSFQFTENELNPQIPGYEKADIILNKMTNQRVLDYMSKLERAGYELVGDTDLSSSYQNAITASILTDYGIYNVGLIYTPNEKQLQISLDCYVDKTRMKAWPSAEVAKAANAKTDGVPAFAGTNKGFAFVSSNGSTYVIVYLEDGTEQAAQTAYIDLLTKQCGYTENGTEAGQPKYRSPNGEINLAISCQPNKFPGQIEILIIPSTPGTQGDWPTSDISSRLTQMGATQDVLPPLEYPYSVIKKSWVTEGQEFKLWATVGEGNIAAAKESYEGTLDDNDFSYEGNEWISPHSEFKVFLTTGNDPACLYIIVSKMAGAQVNWPASEINAITSSKMGATRQTVLPMTGEATYLTSVNYEYDEEGKVLFVICGYKDSDQAAAAYRDYMALVVDRWQAKGADDLGRMHYGLDELEMVVYVVKSSMVLEVRAVEKEVISFPIGQIQEKIGEVAIPDLSIEGTTKYEVTQTGATTVLVTYELPADYTQNEFMLAIAEMLGAEDSGFEYSEKLGGFTNGEIDIYLLDGFGLQISLHKEEEEPEEVTFPIEEIQQYVGEDVEIPDLHVEGVTSYDVSKGRSANTAQLKLHFDAAEYSADDMLEAFHAKLVEEGFYPFGEGDYWNYTIYVFCNGAGAGFLDIVISLRELPSTGYGILYDYANWETAYHYTEYEGYDQWLIRGITLYEGERIKFFNFETREACNVTLQNGSDYLEYDEESGYWVVTQSFTATIYLKLKWADDKVYFDAIRPVEEE